MQLKQSNKRILLKTILYRILGITIMLIVSFLYTKNYLLALSISIFTEIAQTILYLLYEYVWNNITWGLITNL